MSEYEIFNGGDNIEIIPEPKKRKKRKPVKIKNEKSCNCSFLQTIFSYKHLPLTLSIISIFFAFLIRFILLVAPTLGGLITSGIFFIISFSTVFTALILETINYIKTKTFEFNFKTILIILAFLFICI